MKLIWQNYQKHCFRFRSLNFEHPITTVNLQTLFGISSSPFSCWTNKFSPIKSSLQSAHDSSVFTLLTTLFPWWRCVCAFSPALFLTEYQTFLIKFIAGKSPFLVLFFPFVCKLKLIFFALAFHSLKWGSAYSWTIFLLFHSVEIQVVISPDISLVAFTTEAIYVQFFLLFFLGLFSEKS